MSLFPAQTTTVPPGEMPIPVCNDRKCDVHGLHHDNVYSTASIKAMETMMCCAVLVANAVLFLVLAVAQKRFAVGFALFEILQF